MHEPLPSRDARECRGADRWGSMPNGAQMSRGWGRILGDMEPTPAPWRSALSSPDTDHPKTDHSPERTRDPMHTIGPPALARTRTREIPPRKHRNATLGPATAATR